MTISLVTGDWQTDGQTYASTYAPQEPAFVLPHEFSLLLAHGANKK
jgi:hypothetical protein